MAAQVVGRLEQRIKDLETQFDEEQRRLVDAERWVVNILMVNVRRL